MPDAGEATGDDLETRRRGAALPQPSLVVDLSEMDEDKEKGCLAVGGIVPRESLSMEEWICTPGTVFVAGHVHRMAGY